MPIDGFRLSPDSIRGLSLDDLRHLLDCRISTSQVLISTYLDRIAETNSRFHRQLNLKMMFLKMADTIGQEREEKGIRSKLRGIAILGK